MSNSIARALNFRFVVCLILSFRTLSQYFDASRKGIKDQSLYDSHMGRLHTMHFLFPFPLITFPAMEVDDITLESWAIESEPHLLCLWKMNQGDNGEYAFRRLLVSTLFIINDVLETL
jgi:hypothetical protein